MDDRRLLLALSLVPGLGPVTIRRLLKEAPSLKAVFSLPPEKLKACGVRGRLPSLKKALFRAEREEEALLRLKASYVTLLDEDYPPLLRTIPDPPVVLFYKGSLPREEPTLAVVGARAATSYGLSVVRDWVPLLARAGIAIVSGFALGIDRAAHEAALREGGRTYAVLGCGLDVNYPAANARLREEITRRGGLITEFPLGVRPKAANFPIRNRIISGLSQAVLVVEASQRSGSLITARLAGEQGREVFAVPGPVYSLRSRGCHDLLRDGATLADKPEDLLSFFGKEPFKEAPQELTLSPEEAKVLEHLAEEPLSVDELVFRTGLAVEELTGLLTNLELEGLLERLPGNLYRRISGR